MPKLLNLTRAFVVVETVLIVVSSLSKFIPKILTVMTMVVIIHKFWEYDLPIGLNFWNRNSKELAKLMTEFLAIESANQQVHYDGKGLVFCRFPTYPSRRQQKGSSSKEFCHASSKICNWFGFMSVFSHIGPNGHKLEMPTMVNTNHLLLPKALCGFVELSEIKRQGHKYYG
uniref:Transmembrane protein n=1 Tax=Echinococcus canadensis TaxID=519352 RepID=A0A915EYE3_9CEST